MQIKCDKYFTVSEPIVPETYMEGDFAGQIS